MRHLDKKQAQERVVKLRELINDYRYHYHVLDESIMSEAAADSLKHELTQLEEQFPDLITADSPTQRVAGQPLAGFKQIEHSSRMLSLNDIFDKQELSAWIERIKKQQADIKLEFFVDLKMDGLAAALVYENGKYTQAITRGNGFVGEDVTVNVATINSVPFNLRHSPKFANFIKGRTEIRGEIVMLKKDFDALNRQRQQANLPLFANPRNLAAGTIRQLDPKLVAARPLTFRAYDIIRGDDTDIPTYEYAYETLRGLGIPANPQASVFKSIDQVMEFANEWDKNATICPLTLTV